jgi:hypothetical protein
MRFCKPKILHQNLTFHLGATFISFPIAWSRRILKLGSWLLSNQPGLKCRRLSALRPMNDTLRFTVALFTDPTRLGLQHSCSLYPSPFCIMPLHHAAARLILAPGTACFARQRLRWQRRPWPWQIDPSITKNIATDRKPYETIMDETGTDTNPTQTKRFCIGFALRHARVHWQIWQAFTVDFCWFIDPGLG